MTFAVGLTPDSIPESQRMGLPILIASAKEIDHATIDDLRVQRRWRVTHARSCAEALGQIEARRPAVVIADSDIPGGGWRRLLEELGYLPEQPVLIVASRSADTELWAEVLNLGAYDVLQTPFEASELRHVVESAYDTWLRSSALCAWRERAHRPPEILAAALG